MSGSTESSGGERPAEGRWYVVHTYSGYEAKVKASLDERRRAEAARKEADIAVLEAKDTLSGKEQANLAELKTALEQLHSFTRILIPAEKVTEVVQRKTRTSTRKFFPGYILVNVGDLGDFVKGLIKQTPRVTGFVGGTDDPPPISEDEVMKITQQMEDGASKPRVLFAVGDTIKVVDGPFQDFNGTVEEVKPDKGKLRVLISIFGRATPVELEFVQVERA